MGLADTVISIHTNEKIDMEGANSPRSVSSGTFTTLTGIKNGTDIEYIRNAYVDFAQDSKEKFKTWGDAWVAFAKSHGLRVDKRNSSVDGKKLLSKLDLGELGEASKPLEKLSKKAIKSLDNAFQALSDIKQAMMKENEAEGVDAKYRYRDIEVNMQALMKMKKDNYTQS